jgi:hypothetical protein
LEHLKQLQGKLEFHRNKCHHGNAPHTRRQCAKSTDQWAQGVASRPAPLCSLSRVCFMDTLSRRRYQGIRSLKLLEAGLGGRLATWLGRLANTWRVTALIKLVTPPWTPINTPHGIQDTTLYLQFSTCKGCDLVVVVAQAKLCQESRVKSSLRSSGRSSLRD